MITVKTYIHRYPAAELWEKDRWYVRLLFANKYWAQDGWFDSKEEAIEFAKTTADDLGGTYEGEK